MSRTWKDVKPEMRLTAKRFAEGRGTQGRRPDWPGERYPVVQREVGRRRGRRERAA